MADPNHKTSIKCDGYCDALAERANKYETALREIDDNMHGDLPLTALVKEIVRKAREEKGDGHA